jgi:hypothetical protein
MTTFTLQDLAPTKTEQATKLMEDNGMTAPTQINSMEVTQEEEEAMQTLLAQHEQAHKIVQDAPKPQHTPTVQELAQQLTQTFTKLVEAISQPQQASQDLIRTVDTVLEQADWFKEAVEEKVETLVEDMDHSYEIESAVESHFSNSFSLDDHVDISSEVESAVESAVENQIDDVVERILSEKLKSATISFN